MSDETVMKIVIPDGPQTLYLTEDFTRGKPKPYFTAIKGNCVEIIQRKGHVILVKNRDGETTAILKELLVSSPIPNPPSYKEDPLPVITIQEPIPVSQQRSTSPVKRANTKVRHVGATTLF